MGVILTCPDCQAPIGRNWTPYRVQDGLLIAWRCPNGHKGQWNDAEIILKPLGKPDPKRLP